MRGQCEVERCAMPWIGFRPHLSAVAFDDPLAQGQSDASARNLGTVQAFEDTENPIGVLHGKTNAIVSHCKLPKRPLGACLNFNPRRNFRRPVFDGVTDQVLKELNTLVPIPGKDRQVRIAHGSLALIDGRLAVCMACSTT